MRFLCFHGLGTNADIFEIQTAPFREELGGSHEFEFLDGEYEADPAPGIGAIFPGPYFSWYPIPDTAANIRQGMNDIKNYIAENGPYDGAMGFSQGAQMLMGLILEHQLLCPSETPLFQVAIFICGAMSQEQKQFVSQGLQVRIPTAHILGGRKDFVYEDSLKLRDACDKNTRTEYEHDKGHCIPRELELVAAMTNTIRRSVDRAIYQC